MNQPIVRTRQGSVRGFVSKNLDGGKFFGFLGIPYAKPPTGNLRFKAPQPPVPWAGVRPATFERPKNFQRDILTDELEGSEDSLHLSVYTKNLPQQDSLHPVMVWIHDGGFTRGSNHSSWYGPEFLMTEDIVFVSINYRLGLLGFIHAEDPSLEIFGNAGLKDQVAALKWVKANIQSFGGDPNNVTIFGSSAGGMSVQYLLLSKVAEGLFHKAITQSAAVTMLEAGGKPQPNIKELLRTIGKGEMTEKDALNYLRNLSLKELYRLQETYFKNKRSMPLPIVERPNPTAFFTEHPAEFLAKKSFNHVPVINGYNSNECNLLANPMFSFLMNSDEFTMEKVVPTILNLPGENEVCKQFLNKFKIVYEKKVSRFQFISDAAITSGNLLFARTYSKNSTAPLYQYKMSLAARLNIIKQLARVQEPGAGHGDEIGYLFKSQLLNLVKGTPEEKYVRNFLKLWTNFAKYGNPTPAENNNLGVVWKPYTNDNEDFLEINTQLIPGNRPDNERMQIWKDLFDTAKTALFFKSK